jgi:hypothetical protein
MLDVDFLFGFLAILEKSWASVVGEMVSYSAQLWSNTILDPTPAYMFMYLKEEK